MTLFAMTQRYLSVVPPIGGRDLGVCISGNGGGQ